MATKPTKKKRAATKAAGKKKTAKKRSSTKKPAKKKTAKKPADPVAAARRKLQSAEREFTKAQEEASAKRLAQAEAKRKAARSKAKGDEPDIPTPVGPRYIGLRHRIKKTAEGEARPTQVVMIAKGAQVSLELKTEQDEMDFVHGRFPAAWRVAKKGENLAGLPAHHVKKTKKQTRVPVRYEGLAQGDTVSMSLGGSGGILAIALKRQADRIGAQAVRLPPFQLKAKRIEAGHKEDDKEHDAEVLARVAEAEPELFKPVTERDLEMTTMRLEYRKLRDVMEDRIAAEQRLYQQVTGRAFLDEGMCPEGVLDAAYKEAKANSRVLMALRAEESEAEQSVAGALESLDYYTEILRPIEGLGTRLCARFLSAVGNIQDYDHPNGLKHAMGVHVRQGGRYKDVPPDKQFPRFRRSKGKDKDDPEKAGARYRPEGRQVCFLIADQFNKRPDSVWGVKMRGWKASYRERHQPTTVNGKQRYNDAHVMKTANWRTATRFVEWFWKAAWRLEVESGRADRRPSLKRRKRDRGNGAPATQRSPGSEVADTKAKAPGLSASAV